MVTTSVPLTGEEWARLAREGRDEAQDMLTSDTFTPEARDRILSIALRSYTDRERRAREELAHVTAAAAALRAAGIRPPEQEN